MDRAVAVDGTLKQPTRTPKIAIRSPDSFTLVGPLHRFRAIADMPVVGRGSADCARAGADSCPVASAGLFGLADLVRGLELL